MDAIEQIWMGLRRRRGSGTRSATWGHDGEGKVEGEGHPSGGGGGGDDHK
jgi:hypothetical protein